MPSPLTKRNVVHLPRIGIPAIVALAACMLQCGLVINLEFLN